MIHTDVRRRFPIGCEVGPSGAHFRVWAPAVKAIAVVLGFPNSKRESFPLAAEPDGYFAGFAPAHPGSLYRFALDHSSELFPDPASRWQPEGPFGWSQVIDPAFEWTDQHWRGVTLQGQVLYEMHVGSFTPEGTWSAAAAHLQELADLGITVLEIMPVADFPGDFGWGYDGVNPFAPSRLYGTPADLKNFVNQAHRCGLAVILDVVYNHVGPAGNYFARFAPQYFSQRYKTDWGEAINFDGADSAPVREFFLTNASYWIDEFHLDGLRLDATQNIYDAGEPHIVEEIGRAVRKAARGRATIVVAENEPQDSRLVRPAEEGGYALDGMWNDDFHHSAMVALTGRREAYYTDYSGGAQELLSTLKHGFLFQGQRYAWQKQGRGVPALDIAPYRFITFLQNHDQVANTARGWRVNRLTSPGRQRALTVLFLLGPGTPMLFQGQEFDSSSPFLYFADHEQDLAREVRKGRAEFLSQFRSIAEIDPSFLADPADPQTFHRSKLDFNERERNTEALAFHRDLLSLRRNDAVLTSGKLDGAVLTELAFLVRIMGDSGDDRLLLFNMGADLVRSSISEPFPVPLRREAASGR